MAEQKNKKLNTSAKTVQGKKQAKSTLPASITTPVEKSIEKVEKLVEKQFDKIITPADSKLERKITKERKKARQKEKALDEFARDKDILVDVKNVSMRFKLPSERVDNLKEVLIKRLRGKLKYKEHWVLNDVNLTVRRGESLAIIGRNGAGKSTLLSLISGIYEPTKGLIQVRGKIVPLLRLGAGFDTNATGKENVFLNGAILGFDKKELAEKYDEIVEFAELKDFMNVPIKNYSSGMLARLGFAIAVSMKPDIMIVDEILSVGDIPFQRKCCAKIAELQKSGTTFLLVSHNMYRVKELCQKAVWIKDYKIEKQGVTAEVVDAYMEECAKSDLVSSSTKPTK